jgi:hypothetical protein
MGVPKKPRVVDGETRWRCANCKDWKPPSAFYKKKTAANGLGSSCILCVTPAMAKWYQGNKERVKAAGKKRNAERELLHPGRIAAVKREWRRRNPDKVAASVRKSRLKRPDESKACEKVRDAVKSGRLVKPECCEMCDSGRILDGHHDSYDRDRWLVVTWLCRKCHIWTHEKRREQKEGRRDSL